MRQFDVFANPGAARDRPYVIVLQHDWLDSLNSVVVAPLVRAAGRTPSPRLTPVVEIDGAQFLLSIAELAAIDRRRLGEKPVCNLETDRYRILGAIDLLFTAV